MSLPEYRVNPLVSGAPVSVDGTRTLVFERATGRHQFELSSTAFLDICDQATEWTSHPELEAYITEQYVETESEAKEIINSLIDYGMLVERSDHDVSSPTEEFLWSAVGYYDAYVRDWPFMDYSEDDIAATVSERLNAYEDAEDPPEMVKRYPDAEVVELPEIADHDRLRIHQTAPASTMDVDTAYALPDVDDPQGLGSFRAAFERDVQTEAGQLDKSTLGELLFYTFGKIGAIVNDDIPHGPLMLKTSPGHGGLHPIEAYPIVIGVEGIPDGSYHYSVAEHSLERIDIVPSIFKEQERDNGCVYIALTAVVERCMWKYRGARDIRNTLHDLGHLIGTYDLVTTALGVEGRVYPKFDPQTIATELSIDLLDEPPVGILCAN